MNRTFYGYVHGVDGGLCVESWVDEYQKDEMLDSPFVKEVFELDGCKDKYEAKQKLAKIISDKMKDDDLKEIKMMVDFIKDFKKRYLVRCKEKEQKLSDEIFFIIKIAEKDLVSLKVRFKEKYDNQNKIIKSKIFKVKK